jgi:hypothetical protein
MSFASSVTCSASLCQFLFGFGVGRRWLFFLNLAVWLLRRICFHASFPIRCLSVLVRCSCSALMTFRHVYLSMPLVITSISNIRRTMI